MRISEFSRYALGLCAISAFLTGCGASSTIPKTAGQSTAQTRSIPRWPSTARAACSQDRPNAAICLTLILDARLQPNLSGWAPADFQTRYKLPSGSKGSGQIVAIVDAYDNPNVAADLATYRTNFGLGTANLTKYNQKGQKKNYPPGSHGWGIEIDLDVEMVSATCPKCTIYLVEAKSAAGSDLETAEVEAVTLGAHIVSNSWICYASLSCVKQSDFNKPGVIYLASSGDGGPDQIGAPMGFDSVAAIGGTVLSKNGSKYSESVWSSSGGGCATGIKKPKWQHDKICAFRLTNDASAVAMDVALYDSYGYGGWLTVGGTSISAPLLAGVFGLAGNATKQDGGRTFWQTAHHRYLYDLCGSSCLFGQYSYGGGWGSPDGVGAF